MSATANDPLTRIVVTNLRDWRTAEDWSQGELGRRAGVGSAMIAAMESGGRGVTMPMLRTLAYALDVEPHRFLIPKARPQCSRCGNDPMPGYSCNRCGRSGPPPQQ